MRLVRLVLAVCLSIGIIFSAMPKLQADEMSEAILELLIKKGLITEREVEQLKNEVSREEPRVPATMEGRVAVLEEKQSKLPAWIENMKLKGDYRLRYQWTEKSDGEDQHRGRYRFRLGLETEINDLLKVAAGLASGGTDPRSTNQTMLNSFETPDIRLDYAYATYTPWEWLTFKGGKMKGVKNLIFNPSDLLWDTDINPEGAVIQLNKRFEDHDLDLFFNNALWILDESSSDESDPLLAVVQPGFKKKFGDTYVKLAVAGHFFNGVKGSTLDHTAGTNTLDENNLLQFNYTSVNPSLETGIKNPFTGLVPFAALFGDYVYNPAPENENQGFLIGLKFGDKKVAQANDWQFKYMYRLLEADAWPDAFPDADVFGGGTDVEAHEVIFNYGVGKNSSLGVDYYYMERDEAVGRRHILQVDWSSKF